MRRRSDAAPPARNRASSFRCHLCRQPFELAAADVFQILARRAQGRLFVEIHRDLKAFGDGGPRSPRERGAFRHRDVVNRHKRDDVHGADPGCTLRATLILHGFMVKAGLV